MIETRESRPVVVLLAEDDDDDFLLTREAFAQAMLRNELIRLRDGQELVDYLKQAGEFAPPATAPRPGLILLDLNMPRMDGREALAEIKKDPALRSIPIVVLTTSGSEEDVLRSYDLGVNSFVRKPVTFEGLVAALKVMRAYWLEIVALPPTR